MSASIKATCPGCRHLIRIPLDWSERAMKCKKCGTMVQMKKNAPPATTETEVAPPVPTATAPTYEPSFDPPPAPAPATPAYAYPMPPQPPSYGPPPQYAEPPPQPYGYPPQYAPQQPPPYGYPYPPPPAYGYPPQPAYPQPAYPQTPAYPYPAPQPPTPEPSFPIPDESTTPRKNYQRGSGNGAQKLVLLALGAILLVGVTIVAMKFVNGTPESAAQAKADPKPGKAPDAAGNPASSAPAIAPSIISDPFPRRLLFVHVAKYVYFNNLSPGVFGRGEDMPSRTAKDMQFALRVPDDQLFAFIDTAKGTPPPLKGVLSDSFEMFLNTSREQDRIAIYFGGHAREIDGKAYLVPVDGDPDDAATLIPVEELYTKLAACKAQQKVLFFDVCRFNPGYGAARAGSEPMSEKLAEALHKVPPGVQVLTSCSAGQNAQETTEVGSEFLAAFRAKAKELKGNPAFQLAQPGQPIPTEKWADALREHLAAKRDYAPSQTVKATVPQQAPETMIAYKKDEAAAVKFPWPAGPPGAPPGDVNAMLALLELPGVRKEIVLPAGLALVYPFNAEVMKGYAPDVPDADCVTGDKYPLRKATYDALMYVRENWKYDSGEGMRETLNSAIDDKLKKQIMDDQIPLAKQELKLKEHLTALEVAGKKIDEEKSKRWKALYEYALAQLQMRWAFINEYQLALGNIRTDSLEKPSGNGKPLYRLVSVEKMKSKKEISEKAEAARETFEKLAKDHKGTPLEVLAKMNKNVALGLTWKLEVQQEAMADDKMEKKE